MSETAKKIHEWLKKHDKNWPNNPPYFHSETIVGPQEIAVFDNGDWEASHEGHDEFESGHGLEELQKLFQAR